MSRTDRKIKVVGSSILIVMALTLVIVSLIQHHRDQAAATAKRADAKASRKVRSAVATASSTSRQITIVGEARPFLAVQIFAKISGYLDSIAVDKGDRVKKGQVLAQIKALEQGKDYDAAFAEAKNKRAIANRMTKLKERALASDQETEQAQAEADIAEARVGGLGVIKGYEVLKAPFDGQVTGRFLDPGALLQGNAQPVLALSSVDELRVTVYIDQRWAPFIKVGDPAEVWSLERQENRLKGKISRHSGELDRATKMLLTEIDLDNRAGAFVPGSFVQVALSFAVPPQVQIPSNALFSRQDRHLVAVIGKDGVLSYRDVVPGDNDGTMLKLVSGLVVGERAALDLADAVAEGEHVTVGAE